MKKFMLVAVLLTGISSFASTLHCAMMDKNGVKSTLHIDSNSQWMGGQPFFGTIMPQNSERPSSLRALIMNEYAPHMMFEGQIVTFEDMAKFKSGTPYGELDKVMMRVIQYDWGFGMRTYTIGGTEIDQPKLTNCITN